MSSRLTSPGLKAIALGLLVLVLMIPLLQVRGLIDERQGRAYEAGQSIAFQWGQAQTLAPAYIVADVPRRYETDSGFRIASEPEVVLPDSVEIEGELTPEVRSRGMFDVPVYVATLQVRARFVAADIDALRARSESGKPLALRLALSDPRGLREFGTVEVSGTPTRVAAVGPDFAGLLAFGTTFGESGGDLEVAYSMRIAGARELRALPLGRTTSVRMRGAWGDPSFLGAYLPAERTVTPERFDARWQILEFSRDFAQQGPMSMFAGITADAASFGVGLFQPADVYQQNERSGKYGILVVALLFIALFLFEFLANVTLHPLQYLLIGLALATFYLVLLALSEHIGFGLAYLVAAVAAVALVGAYTAAALRSRNRGLAVAGLQAAAYGVFYVLVRSEDYALLMGATVLFAALAAVMWLTRKTDWYALARSPGAATQPT
jgi:inner membrane protein